MLYKELFITQGKLILEEIYYHPSALRWLSVLIIYADYLESYLGFYNFLKLFSLSER